MSEEEIVLYEVDQHVATITLNRPRQRNALLVETRLGVGTLLLRHLYRCAETAGIKKIEGTALRENRYMLKFARGFRFEARIESDDASLVHLSRVFCSTPSTAG